MKQLTSRPAFMDAVGGDMEAWGMYQAIRKAATDQGIAFEWIVVKGICDWGFEKKKGWQPFAAAAAMDLIFTVISAPGFLTGQQQG